MSNESPEVGRRDTQEAWINWAKLRRQRESDAKFAMNKCSGKENRAPNCEESIRQSGSEEEMEKTEEKHTVGTERGEQTNRNESKWHRE